MSGGWEVRLQRIRGAQPLTRRADGLWMEAPDVDVEALARAMAEEGARLITITGLPGGHGEVTIIYHYALETGTIHVKTVSRRRSVPSIAAIAAAARWIEREVADLYGVRFDGHPDPRRLVRPPALAPGFFEAAADSNEPTHTSNQ